MMIIWGMCIVGALVIGLLVGFCAGLTAAAREEEEKDGSGS